MRYRRRVLSTLAALSGVLLLAGCSSTPKGGPTTSASPAATTATSAAPVACPSAGSASNAVKVTGSGTAEPTVSFPKSTKVTTTERTTVRHGSGPEVKDGDTVSIAYVMYDATSGKKLDSRGWSASSRVQFPVNATVYLGFREALVCTKEGDTVAAVIPASAAFGTAGSKQIGVAGGDSIVFVADVVAHTPTKATGETKALPADFPQVTLAATGQPTVKIPAASPPKTLKIADREVGSGTTVKSGDTVTVQYQGVLWRTGAVFDQSWTKTGPTSFATTQVVKGFGKALVGQKVGSQVVAIVPPSDGYGTTGSTGAGIKGTDTMVFVIDILATAHAS